MNVCVCRARARVSSKNKDGHSAFHRLALRRRQDMAVIKTKRRAAAAVRAEYSLKDAVTRHNGVAKL